MHRFSEVCRGCGATRSYDFMGVIVRPCNCAIQARRGAVSGVIRLADFVEPSQPTDEKDRRCAIAEFGRGWRRYYRSGPTECHYCQQPFTESLPPTIEHITPRSQGGTRERSTLACRPCNSARSDAPYDVYMAAVERERVRASRRGEAYRRPVYRHRPSGAVIT